ncbi:hypothetical protein B0H10DRAFT_1957976 [Mycena sp. CBHHK59/15]|nr:hypothetical protein B0H10DRAFT_1957976 [Mycena sp. CBHHK59/15]
MTEEFLGMIATVLFKSEAWYSQGFIKLQCDRHSTTPRNLDVQDRLQSSSVESVVGAQHRERRREGCMGEVTPLHPDNSDPKKGWAALVVLGPFTGGALHIPSLKLHMRYTNGDMILIRGRILPHEVEAFHDGQRIYGDSHLPMRNPCKGNGTVHHLAAYLPTGTLEPLPERYSRGVWYRDDSVPQTKPPVNLQGYLLNLFQKCCTVGAWPTKNPASGVIEMDTTAQAGQMAVTVANQGAQAPHIVIQVATDAVSCQSRVKHFRYKQVMTINTAAGGDRQRAADQSEAADTRQESMLQ